MKYFFLMKSTKNRKIPFFLQIALLFFCQHLSAQETTEPGSKALVLPAQLNPIIFVQLLAEKNADILMSRINANVNDQLYKSESGIYEPIAYTTTRKEGRFRLNTIEEQIVSSNLPFLEEKVLTNEVGIKEKLPTGADATLGYQVVDRHNNLIPTQTNGLFQTEFTSSLVFTVKQPLLRGFGRDVTETNKKLAELDFLISKEQFKQQLFKSAMDGLNLYWQLYKNQSALILHKQGFQQAQDLLKNVTARFKAGKISESALLEVRSMILLRDIEYQRSKQAFLDAKLKLLTSLGSKNVDGLNIHLNPDEFISSDSPWNSLDSYMLPKDTLKNWPLFTIASLRKQQAEVKLSNLKNQNKPVLDFVMSGSGTGFAYNESDAERDARGRKYPDWYIGINFEMPMGGNYKATGQYGAQIERITQSEIELSSITVSNANELLSATEESKISAMAVQQSEQDVQLQQTIYDNEVRRFMLGNTILSTVIQKSNELMDAKMRHIDNQVKFEQAKTMFYIYSGQFFDHYRVSCES
jgi:outer membrane protein TolC